MNRDHYEKLKRVSQAFRGSSSLASSTVSARDWSILTSTKKGGRLIEEYMIIEQCRAVESFWRIEFPEEEGFGARFHLDLYGANLAGETFAGWCKPRHPLERADFRNAMLDQSAWVMTSVAYANFTGASLHQCLMRVVNLEGAVFREADLSEAELILPMSRPENDAPPDFTGANLRGAVIELALPTHMILTEANLEACHVHVPGQTKTHTRRVLEQFIACLSEEQIAHVTLEGLDLTSKLAKGKWWQFWK